MGKKASEEATKQVIEVILSEKGERKRKQTLHSEETRTKIGCEHAAIN